ncbi:hypothetical protein ACWGQ5_30115 [Streptomyces sp. NPDC055722]
MHIQYSRDGEQWADLLTTEATWSGSGYAFSVDIPNARRGYFRAHFKATEAFPAATSETVEARR